MCCAHVVSTPSNLGDINSSHRLRGTHALFGTSRRRRTPSCSHGYNPGYHPLFVKLLGQTLSVRICSRVCGPDVHEWSLGSRFGPMPWMFSSRRTSCSPAHLRVVSQHSPCGSASRSFLSPLPWLQQQVLLKDADRHGYGCFSSALCVAVGRHIVAGLGSLAACRAPIRMARWRRNAVFRENPLGLQVISRRSWRVVSAAR